MLIFMPDNAVNFIQTHVHNRIKYFPVINAVTTELVIKYMTFSIKPKKNCCTNPNLPGFPLGKQQGKGC